MHSPHVPRQMTFLLCNVRAQITRECPDVTKTVNSRQMQFQSAFLSEGLRTDVTLERLDVTNAVNSR